MIKAWTDGAEAGLLDRRGERGSTFVYMPGSVPERSVSVTMPVRTASWNTAYGLAPIFEMNLPEGALRERLRLRFAKPSGTFDELDVLAVVGRSQVGRIRYTGQAEQLHESVPFQSVDEILAQRRGGELYRYLLDKFAQHSGISGVQPKVLIRDTEHSNALKAAKVRLSQSFQGATHIVKFWEPDEFPQLAANEYFCLQAAENCDLNVPRYRLAEDGMALVVDRFDLRPDGTYCGFEDFCVLNAKRSADKYMGSYETAIIRRFEEYGRSDLIHEEQEHLFMLIALNCALRNGDAHLKNFGIIYDDVNGDAHLAPVYDLITTTVYLEQDQMALTLNGSKRWPSSQQLRALGETRMHLPPSRVVHLLQRIDEAVDFTRKQMGRYISDHAEFADIGNLMLRHWQRVAS